MKKLEKIIEKLYESYSLFDRDLTLPNEMNIPFVESKADVFRAIKKLENLLDEVTIDKGN